MVNNFMFYAVTFISRHGTGIWRFYRRRCWFESSQGQIMAKTKRCSWLELVSLFAVPLTKVGIICCPLHSTGHSGCNRETSGHLHCEQESHWKAKLYSSRRMLYTAYRTNVLLLETATIVQDSGGVPLSMKLNAQSIGIVWDTTSESALSAGR